MDLENYKKVLLDHARHPRHQKLLPIFSHSGECHNPLCGDQVSVDLLVRDRLITDIHIKAVGCTMATASASLMSDLVNGKTIEEAMTLKESFENALVSEEPWPEELQDLIALSHLRVNRTRVPCAAIGWIALQKALGLKA